MNVYTKRSNHICTNRHQTVTLRLWLLWPISNWKFLFSKRLLSLLTNAICFDFQNFPAPGDYGAKINLRTTKTTRITTSSRIPTTYSRPLNLPRGPYNLLTTKMPSSTATISSNIYISTTILRLQYSQWPPKPSQGLPQLVQGPLQPLPRTPIAYWRTTTTPLMRPTSSSRAPNNIL